MEQNKANGKKRDRIGIILYAVYVLLLAASVFLCLRIADIQLFFSPDPGIREALSPKRVSRVIEPVRGNIIDRRGRLLAITQPKYQIAMDCTVQKEAFAKDAKNGAEKEAKWRSKAKALSEELAKEFPEKSAAEYYKQIISGRENGKRYLKFGKPVDRNAYNRIKEFPLFSDGKFKGGFLADPHNIRFYPYGKLARRTIGFVRDNSTGVGNTHVGLEGRYDHLLHGKDGKEWLRITDAGRVLDNDSTKVRPEDGKDIRTTIDIDYQEMAWRALYNEIKDKEDLEAACLVLMEASTGAIRAMVNLHYEEITHDFEETSNIAIGRAIEPGSVMKTVTLMQVLNDGHIKSLDETMPTNHGRFSGIKRDPDDHIPDFERKHNTNVISIIDGFKISSNYVFGTLAMKYYGQDQKRFAENLHSYKLIDTFDFDLDGLAAPSMIEQQTVRKKKQWSQGDMCVMGFGYGIMVTPLHVLMFYNAIANKGRMMKPYLVEDIEFHGEVKDRRGPALMSTICSKAIADTLTRALRAVTEEGTAKRLKGAKCSVAGKTGTSFATDGRAYSGDDGHLYQGTFAGFFPAEDPKYSVLCTIFSKPTHTQYQGGGIPARAIRTLVDELYCNDPCFRQEISAAE